MSDDELEALVDRVGLRCVLDTLANIASEKADHIRETWNDRTLERAWRRASNTIEVCANHTAITAVSP